MVRGYARNEELKAAQETNLPEAKQGNGEGFKALDVEGIKKAADESGRRKPAGGEKGRCGPGSGGEVRRAAGIMPSRARGPQRQKRLKALLDSGRTENQPESGG